MVLCLKLGGFNEGHWMDFQSCGYTLLHVAAMTKGDNLDMVKKIIRLGVNINAQNENGLTALVYAVILANTKIIEYLISIGATNADYMPDGYNICAINDINTIRIFINNKFKIIYNKYDPRYNEILKIKNATQRCRSAVIAMLTLKKRARVQFINLDKFVLREIAIALWATRKVENDWI